MSLHFRALEVEEGDAFLLQDSNWCCLFDSGKSPKDIISLLDNHAIDKIDLAICSHNDIDHSNGFLGLLKSSKTISEIWLPALWANLTLFVIEHHCEIDFEVDSAPDPIDIDYLRHYFIEDSNNEVLESSILETLFEFNKEPFETEHFNHFLKNFSENVSKYFPIHCPNCMFKTYKNYLPPKQYDNLVKHLGNIMDIATLACKKGSVIRWFEPGIYCLNNEIAYGFVALNSHKIATIKRIKGFVQFLTVLQLTVVNKYSLVFEYKKNDTPVVRFSADSDSSCQSVYPYKNNIIITVPHHGSRSNDCVYQNIKGDDIIWVRSGNTNGTLSDSFMKFNPKFCVSCHFRAITSEIHFIFDERNQKWIHVSGKFCNC